MAFHGFVAYCAFIFRPYDIFPLTCGKQTTGLVRELHGGALPIPRVSLYQESLTIPSPCGVYRHMHMLLPLFTYRHRVTSGNPFPGARWSYYISHETAA